MRIIRSASQLHPVEENEPEGAGPDYATVDPPDNSLVQRKAATLPQQYVPNGSTQGMKRNSDDLSSFSEMTDDSVQLSTGQAQPLPPYHHAPRQPETGVYHMGEQRESVFSETSTEEPSISSGSIREASPTGEPQLMYTYCWSNCTLSYGTWVACIYLYSTFVCIYYVHVQCM